MQIVIAPDKFKGSLSASEVIEHLTIGLLTTDPVLDILGIPMADGGEGTLDAAIGSASPAARSVSPGPRANR